MTEFSGTEPNATIYRELTRQTYEQAAPELARAFEEYPVPIADINRAIKLWGGKTKPVVIELGCGDGRAAAVIAKKSHEYIGIDQSESMVAMADSRNAASGRCMFTVADMAVYKIPERTNIIFAFASLLHLSPRELDRVFDSAAASMSPGGIFYLTTKNRTGPDHEVINDTFGTRQFYYYTPEDMEKSAYPYFENVYQHPYRLGDTEWFAQGFRKY